MDYDYFGMDFSQRDFKNSPLMEICFSHCNFKHTNFYKADLEGAELNNCDLTGADFCRANLRGCNLEMSKASEANFHSAVFDQHTRLPFSHSEARAMGMIFRQRESLFSLGKYPLRLFGS